MAIVRSIQNQYRGINVHLQSRLKSENEWANFHINFICDVTRLMQAILFPLGYTAHTEQSLQIRRYDKSPHGKKIEYYHAVGIYHSNEQLVTWLELLSPSRSPRNYEGRVYRAKRENLLQAGIIFIEVDFLHEQSPMLEIAADYRTRGSKHPPESGAHPYRIAVIDPRPEFRSGQARVRQVDVDEPLPVMMIPLLGEDRFDFDFGAAYRKTFTEMFYGNRVDYGELPLNFDRYSEADQQRILCRMLAVLKAAQAGVDLEKSAPLAVESLSLDEAREQFEALRTGEDFGG